MTQSPRNHRRRRTKTAPSPRLKSLLLDAGILVLTFAVGVFAFSLVGRLGYSRAGGLPETPDVLRVQILNGCGERGAAAKVSDLLLTKAAGNWRFDVVDAGNFDRFDIDKTFIISRTLPPSESEQIARALGLESDAVTQGNNERNALALDMTLVLGKDYETKLVGDDSADNASSLRESAKGGTNR